MFTNDEKMIRLLGAWLLEKEEPQDWAATMLEAGHDSKSLRTLASFTSFDSPSERSEYLKRAFLELGLEFDREAIANAYITAIAGDVVEKRIGAIDGAEEICRALKMVSYDSEIYSNLYPDWAGIDEEIWALRRNPSYRFIFFAGEQEMIAEILKQAIKLTSRERP